MTFSLILKIARENQVFRTVYFYSNGLQIQIKTFTDVSCLDLTKNAINKVVSPLNPLLVSLCQR